MSRQEKAAFAHLRRQRSMLETWGRSLDNMLRQEPKYSARFCELTREREQVDKEIIEKKMLRKEMNRVTHQLRHAV